MSELKLNLLIQLQDMFNEMEHENYILKEEHKEMMVELSDLKEKYTAVIQELARREMLEVDSE